MNKIKVFYWYVGLPIAAVAFGTFFFFNAILSTVRGNPHPQINYIIFALIFSGCIMMWYQVVRMTRDAKRIEEYYALAVTKPEIDVLRQVYSGKHNDTDAVFVMVTDILGGPITPVQHAAIESELERYRGVQARYLSLPNFMGGMMVGMGLLGTFIGLLGALAEIGKLIGSFSMVGGTDPVEAIRILVERLTLPMQAMGVAFSASLFGVMGSLIMGVMMVSVRNCSGELNFLLESRITYIIDFTHEAPDMNEVSILTDAVSKLAEQSPVLRGLAQAMDQSERRVRELVNTMIQLTSRIERGEASSAALIEGMQTRMVTEDAIHQSMQATQTSLAEIATRWGQATQIETQIAEMLTLQRIQDERFFTSAEQAREEYQNLATRLSSALSASQVEQSASTEWFGRIDATLSKLAETNSHSLEDLAGVQRLGSDQFIKNMQAGFADIAGSQRRNSADSNEIILTGFSDLVGLLRRSATDSNEVILTGLKDMAGAQRRAAEDVIQEQTAMMERLTSTVVSGQTSQASLTQQIARIPDVLTMLASANQAGLQEMMSLHQRDVDKTTREQADVATRLSKILQDGQNAQLMSLQNLDATVNSLVQMLHADGDSRSQINNRMELLFTEMGFRQDQFSQSMLQSLAVINERNLTEKS